MILNNKNIFYIILGAIFIFAGILGHDPWKQDETYSFGIIYHFYATHSWLIPKNAGTPFMEKPPLYYWTAVIFCKIFSGIFPLHDAARLTSAFYMIIASVFIWKLSELLFKSRDWCLASLFLFMGTFGIVRHSHDMFTDVALLAGTTMALYGMALILKREDWKRAGLWLGMGVGIAFLSKGIFIPVLFVLSGVVLLVILPEVRTKSTARAVALSFVVAAPFLLIWPIYLHEYSYELFMQWFWENNIGRFLGFSVGKLGADNKPFFILYTVLWFAFPVFPLAVFAAVKDRLQWKNPEYILPAVFSVIGMALLLTSASARALYLLPFIPTYTLLAVQGLTQLPVAFQKHWNRIIRIISVLGVVGIWAVWLSLHHLFALPHIDKIFPLDFTPGNEWIAIAVAFLATLIFLCSLKEKPQTAHIWFCSIATLWILNSTLLLPWVDETKSYRSVLVRMYDYISHSPYKDYCQNHYKLGESIAPMIEYFSADHKLDIVNSFDEAKCPLMITSSEKTDPEELAKGWNLVWRGSRALDAKNEEMRVYVRK